MIFFSYSRADAEFALRLYGDLQTAGAAVWIDQVDINSGERWDVEIQKALRTSDSVLFIVSAASVISTNVSDEVNYALDKGKKVYPIIVNNCDLPYRTHSLQHNDFTGEYAKGLTALQKALNLHTEKGGDSFRETDTYIRQGDEAKTASAEENQRTTAIVESRRFSNKLSLIIILFISAALFIGIVRFFFNPFSGKKAGSQEQCLTSAWNNYNTRQWTEAIGKATDCAIEFAPHANQLQRKLADEGYELPSNYTMPGALTSQQKLEIFSHGPLNDVSVYYWLVGMSNLRINDTQAARQAFQQAIILSFGLCYDPKKDLFWSPAEESKLQLNALVKDSANLVGLKTYSIGGPDPATKSSHVGNSTYQQSVEKQTRDRARNNENHFADEHYSTGDNHEIHSSNNTVQLNQLITRGDSIFNRSYGDQYAVDAYNNWRKECRRLIIRLDSAQLTEFDRQSPTAVPAHRQLIHRYAEKGVDILRDIKEKPKH